MKSYSIVSVCFMALVLVSGFKPLKNRQYISNYENVLGTSLELKIDAYSEKSAEIAEKIALDEIERLNNILSSYKSDSEFKKWDRSIGKSLKVSEDLLNVLNLYSEFTKSTKGALNPAAETIGKVWKNAAAEKHLPEQGALLLAVEMANKPHWELNLTEKTATRLDNAPLALNSFVKSYIINKAAAAALEESGVNGVIVNIGGDIVVKGTPQEKILISNPLADAENDAPLSIVNVKNKAIATSGNYRRGYQINNKWFSHIVDPRTGIPADEIISATVISDDASTAGALATAFNVLNVEESVDLAKKYKDVEYLIVKKNGATLKSKGWKNYESKSVEKVIPTIEKKKAQNNDKLWNEKFELQINLELALVEGQRIHRPFVAIWIEDAEKKPVRNLTLWFNKTKWLPDLKNWYRAYGLDYNADPAAAKSVSSATRSPGKYTVKWDGKDDNGKLVKAGNYIVNVEVVREHGTYQLLNKQMSFTSSEKTEVFPSNVEVANASFVYKKK